VTFAALLSCAAADEPPDTLGPPTTLRLDLVGSVTPRCGFATAPAQNAALGELGVGGDLRLDFTLDCNAMFAVRIVSDEGGLVRVGSAVPSAGFASSLDYDLTLRVDTDLGTVSAACAASELAAPDGCMLSSAQGLSSGSGIAIGTDGQLVLHWEAPEGKLTAGSYRDSIVITVEART
jgi:hypothetical protein